MIGPEKHIDLNADSFTIEGRKFIIYNFVPAERYRIMQRLQIQGRFGASVEQLHQVYKKWSELKNKQQGHTADVLMANTFEGVTRLLNGQHDPLLYIATLFISEEGEDRSTWSEAEANIKIELWGRGGAYDIADFMLLGAAFCRIYQRISLDDTPDSLPPTEEQS